MVDEEHGGFRWGIPLAVLFALLLVAVGIGRIANSGGPPDYDGPGDGEVVIVVHKLQPLTEIGMRLRDEQVVKSLEAFTEAAEHTLGSKGIGPGAHTVRRHMKARDALTMMLGPGKS
ncbi:hypothetical protein R8Z50_16445 [Longispora sp. K20-0274]|uniref:hypothetical protein n=1 Tax=Longispora sp. K20-0274 TaxID=3088255 RepID=UPI00399B0896